MTDDVWTNHKPPAIDCPCGCGASGQPTKNGHPKGCANTCVMCRNRRNKRKGSRKQVAARKALGVPNTGSLAPGNEEHFGGNVRTEVKAGARGGANKVLTAYRNAEAQSEAARAFGDHRPFVAMFMPDGVKYGLVVIRSDVLEQAVLALFEQFGLGEAG